MPTSAREVAIAIERIRTHHPDEARTLEAAFENIELEVDFTSLLKDVSEVKGRAIALMERNEPIYERGVAALEAMAANKKEELRLQAEAQAMEKQRLDLQRQADESRIQNVWGPIAAGIAGLITGLATHIPSWIEALSKSSP